MEWRERIERRPEVLGGKPVIRGTRIAVELILERLGDGWSEKDLLESWPHLAPEDIRAAQAYAASALSSDETVFLDRGRPGRPLASRTRARCRLDR
jgi:uncharacterized protein (DUF433 family)